MTDNLLDSIQADLNKEFGGGTAKRLSSADTLSRIDHWTSSRSIVVDKVLAGGRAMPCSLVPFGRQMEVSGLPGTGKTTLCAQIAAEVQSKGGSIVVTDTEERIDHPYWSQLGVDTSRIINLAARTLEEVFERQLSLIKMLMAKAPDTPVLMLWDSLGGTSTQSIMDMIDEGSESPMEVAKKAMMMKARVISWGMEMINPYISKSKVAYVYTNTLYSKPNVKWGDPFETPGGNKKNFMATVRLRLERVGQIAEKDDVTGNTRIYGNKVEVTALKNSMAPMQISANGAVMGGKGFSNEWTVREVGEALKLISKAGAWSTWKTPLGDDVKFQGFNGFLEKVVPHAEYSDLVAAVTEAL
jgi:recombination protein RecA